MREQTSRFVNGDISERKRGVRWAVYVHTCVCTLYSVGWGVDEVCTGSPLSMDGVVMDSVTSASYSALRCARFVSNMCTRLTIIHVFFMLHPDVCISCIFSITVFLHNSIIMPATVKRLVDITVGLSTSI